MSGRLVTHSGGSGADECLEVILCQSSVRADLSQHQWHHISLTYTEKIFNNYTDATVGITLLIVLV